MSAYTDFAVNRAIFAPPAYPLGRPLKERPHGYPHQKSDHSALFPRDDNGDVDNAVTLYDRVFRNGDYLALGTCRNRRSGKHPPGEQALGIVNLYLDGKSAGTVVSLPNDVLDPSVK